MIGRRFGAHSGDKLPGSVAGFMQPARPMTRSLKVLIVDDEPDILRIGELSLGELARWNVVVAHNSEEALAIAQSDQLDVILLDMMLPDADEQTKLFAFTGRTHPEEAPGHRLSGVDTSTYGSES